MSFKEKAKEFGGKAKRFWKEHWKGICLAGGGLTLTGAILYGLHKSGSDDDEASGAIDEVNKAISTIEDKTAWNKDWDEMAVSFELDTHQPLGSFKNGYTEEEGYVDPLEGNCFIIAGCNSYYNDSPDQLDFYVLDNEGYFHKMPDELRT